MKSTSTSNEVISLKEFSLNYNHSTFSRGGFRDIFVSFLSSPLLFFMRRKKKISILKNINFTIDKGERVALIGANGVGKTSICRAIAGIYGKQPSIKVNGKVRAIFNTSTVVQAELTGRENIHILVNILYPEFNKQERLDIANDSIKFAELGKFIDSPFKHYSKGMCARLFLSVVSSRPADLLILDEVFAGADQFFNEKIAKRIKNIIAKSGAVIFISHDESTLKEVCNRGIVFHKGKIVHDSDIDSAIKFYEKVNRNELNGKYI